jgi:hypothetical protein
VILKYRGFSPHSAQPYAYSILCENGHADIIYEAIFTTANEMEMPDELWNEGSGWATIECDSCKTVYRERSRPGNVVACPCCAEPQLIPEDIELEESNLE